MNELKTFLELWEIPITRRNLEAHLEQLVRIFKDDIAAARRDKANAKINVQVFVNTEAPVAADVIQ